MKRLMVVLVVLGFLVMSRGSVFAGWLSKEQPEVTTVVKEKVTVVKEPATVVKAVAQKNVSNAQQEAISKKKAELNGTQWVIETKPMNAKGKAEKDVLSFVNNQVGSKNMEVKGYLPTNFSMRLLEDNETYAWETMQISEKEGVAFWRGDIGPDGIMRGVVSIRNKNGIVSDFNFYSVEASKVAVEAVAVVE